MSETSNTRDTKGQDISYVVLIYVALCVPMLSFMTCENIRFKGQPASQGTGSSRTAPTSLLQMEKGHFCSHLVRNFLLTIMHTDQKKWTSNYMNAVNLGRSVIKNPLI